LLAVLSLGSECNIGGDNTRLTADAEFDPDTPANAFAGVSETTQAVAQTFTILADGKFEQIDLVVTQGASADSGIVRVDVRPTDAAGVPDLSAASAIASLEIDTLDLPPTLVDEFTTFDFGDQPGRKVRAGEVYAAVVEFVSRDGSTDDLAIATVLGVGIGAGDPYPDGEGFTGASGIAFMPNTDEYFFRTFSRQ
jgi:hypothetical protein